jgi:hypothetical protein
MVSHLLLSPVWLSLCLALALYCIYSTKTNIFLLMQTVLSREPILVQQNVLNVPVRDTLRYKYKWYVVHRHLGSVGLGARHP